MIRFLILLAAYAFLPHLQYSTGYYILILLVLFPLLNCLLGLLAGMKFGFEWLFPFLSGILFLPFVYLYYNSSAFIYCFAYAVSALLGEWIGASLKGRFSRSN